MDLSQQFPRSVRDRIAGVVMLARTTDKARAQHAGTIGEYHYNCPMDQAVFGFLGIDHDTFLRHAAQLDDAKLEAWVRDTYVTQKDATEVAAWNETYLRSGPDPSSESEASFLELRNSIAPDRTDVTAWADLLDLDEGRAVPQRMPA